MVLPLKEKKNTRGESKWKVEISKPDSCPAAPKETPKTPAAAVAEESCTLVYPHLGLVCSAYIGLAAGAGSGDAGGTGSALQGE